MSAGGQTGAALIWCPFPDVAAARAACRALLAERLVACVNIVPQITSLFLWEGAIEEAEEAAVLCKTGADALDAALARLTALHPYRTPAVVGWRADATGAPTSAWLAAALAGPDAGPQG